MGENEQKTIPPVERVLSPAQLTGTGIVKMRNAEVEEHKLDVEADVAKAKIAADLEAKRIDADLEAKRIAATTANKQIDAAVDDNRGDNTRAGIRTAGIAVVSIIGTAGAVLITMLALYYRQPIMLRAFGYDLSTGGVPDPVEQPEKLLGVVPATSKDTDTDATP